MIQARHVGKDLPRPDAADKATGRAAYIHDLSRPGMLWGKIKFSAHASARIVHVDTSRAERLPGVRAVVTGYDTPEIRIGFLRDNFVLKRDRVRQFRDEVAAVAAVDADVAAEAVELIRVEYEPLPAVFSPEEAVAEGAPLVHERDAAGKPLTSNVLPVTVRHSSGDLAAMERASKWVVEGAFSTPLVQQSCMGTAGCIAEMDARGNLTIWTKTQIPFLAQRDFVRALEAMGLPGRHVRVVVPALGGAFGSGLDTHAYEYVAILLARRTGRPVKVLYDRREEFSNLSPRQSTRTRVVQGLDAERRLTFRKVEVLQDNGAYTSWGATYPTVMLIPATSLYRPRAVELDAKLVYTNNTYAQAMRGYGNPEVTWPIECLLDELAERASIDPLELRLRNKNEPGEKTPMGLQVTTCGLGECLQLARRSIGWDDKRGKQRHLHRGVGISSLVHVGGSGRIYRSDGGGVILKLDDFGNVDVAYGGVEMGQGLHAALTAAVADALGVLPERVMVHPTDTATCPWDVGTHASRGAFIACNAAILAARKAREKLFDFAAETLGVAASNLDMQDGVVFDRTRPGEARARMDLGRLLRAMHFRGARGAMVTEEAFYEPVSELPDWSKGVGNMSASYAYGVQAFEVEVDEETGDVRILHGVSAHDVGRVLNPQTLRGQVQGGLAQGVGFALYEEVKTAEGRVLNPSFTDYKIPTAHEMAFPVDVHFVETHDPAGPFGAKGVGEPGLVPTAPALANAIWDAVGVRIRDLPITPEKIVQALAEKKKRS